MNKRLALVSLIKQSLLLTSDVKIALLKRVGELDVGAIDLVGKYLADERNFITANAGKIQQYADTLIHDMDFSSIAPTNTDNRVYVGTGKAG